MNKETMHLASEYIKDRDLINKWEVEQHSDDNVEEVLLKVRRVITQAYSDDKPELAQWSFDDGYDAGYLHGLIARGNK
jgi:hypothetical protein